jgi:NADH-quinone oxidoreductase subunit C
LFKTPGGWCYLKAEKLQENNFMTNEIIQQKLTEAFGEQLAEWETPYGMLTFAAPAQKATEVLGFLKSEAMGFGFMTDLTAIHYPDRTGEEFCVVYLLNNMVARIRVRMKVYLPAPDPEVASAVGLYATANWLERETYDFFGIRFAGHPDLTRIMNSEEMDYFPLRKEYTLEDPTRRDKDDAMFGRG